MVAKKHGIESTLLPCKFRRQWKLFVMMKYLGKILMKKRNVLFFKMNVMDKIRLTNI